MAADLSLACAGSSIILRDLFTSILNIVHSKKRNCRIDQWFLLGALN